MSRPIKARSNSIVIDEDEMVSLAVSSRLRAAVSEFIHLEEQIEILSPSERQYSLVKQNVAHVSTDIRGTKNELAYWKDQL